MMSMIVEKKPTSIINPLAQLINGAYNQQHPFTSEMAEMHEKAKNV
jgi:hypothetical protein